MPRLAELDARYAEEGLAIVSVAFDDDADAVRAMVADRGLGWIQVCDQRAADGALAKTFNATGFPTYYVVGRDGRLLAKKLPLAEIEALIEHSFESADAQPGSSMPY